MPSFRGWDTDPKNREAFGRYADGTPLKGHDLYDFIRHIGGNDILLGFSRGKDSIATWLELRDYGFNIFPYYMYLAPNLRHVEETLVYYEEYFDTPILRYPEPILFDMWSRGTYQLPHTLGTVIKPNLIKLELWQVEWVVAQTLGLDPTTTYSAVGFRSAENIDRRNLIKREGVVGRRRKHFYTIWDWDIKRTAQRVLNEGILLPADYPYWGGTITALDYQYMKPLREHFPDDFDRLCECFPLLELEMFRYETVNAYVEQSRDLSRVEAFEAFDPDREDDYE